MPKVCDSPEKKEPFDIATSKGNKKILYADIDRPVTFLL